MEIFYTMYAHGLTEKEVNEIKEISLDYAWPRFYLNSYICTFFYFPERGTDIPSYIEEKIDRREITYGRLTKTGYIPLETVALRFQEEIDALYKLYLEETKHEHLE